MPMADQCRVGAAAYTGKIYFSSGVSQVGCTRLAADQLSAVWGRSRHGQPYVRRRTEAVSTHEHDLAIREIRAFFNDLISTA